MVYDFVYVVLVYRNTLDLEQFFIHQTTPNSKVIVVNSFFDEKTETQFRKIALLNDADFISLPNKGYGFGNNRGCEFALKKYDFKYLIVSNADIEVVDFNIEMLAGCDSKIVAPRLVNKKGHNQNPANPYASSKLYLRLMKFAFEHNKRRLLYIFAAVSRFRKLCFNLIYFFFKHDTIFAPHGAFTIISHSALLKLYPIYNENIFLFCEEPHLGCLARANQVSIVYKPTIKIFHKEDGSMNVASINIFEKTRESFLKFYNYWYEKNNL